MIVVDGGDGTGKSTLVAALRARGYLVADRGLPTKATDDGLPAERLRPERDVYVILDAPEATCRARLAEAGKDLNEKWHTPESIAHYRVKFREVAAGLGVPLIDSSGTREETLAAVLARLSVDDPARPLRLGVPKGRLFEGALAALAAAGCPLDVLPRDYHPRCPDGTVRPFILKPRSVPSMVAHGLLDAGLCGRDLIAESGYDERLEVAVDLGTQRVRLCVAAADPGLLAAPPPRPVIIATEFPLLADRWATGRGLAHITINTWGSTEAWVPEHADLALDVVETGDTLAANGLCVLEQVLETTTCVVVRRGGAAAHHRLVAALRERATT